MDMNKGFPDESVRIQYEKLLLLHRYRHEYQRMVVKPILNSTYLQVFQSNIKSRTMPRTLNYMIFTLMQLS